MRQPTKLLALIVGVLTAFGCQGAKEVIGVLGELRAVQNAVVRATGHDNVTVNLRNNRFLTIGMVNSPFGTLPDDRRRAKAREIAEVAIRSLPSRASLESVVVNFVVHRRYFMLFSYTNAMDSFTFKVSELGQPAAETPASGSGQ